MNIISVLRLTECRIVETCKDEQLFHVTKYGLLLQKHA